MSLVRFVIFFIVFTTYIFFDVMAYETDQYTLPKNDLNDSKEYLEGYFLEKLDTILARVNKNPHKLSNYEILVLLEHALEGGSKFVKKWEKHLEFLEAEQKKYRYKFKPAFEDSIHAYSKGIFSTYYRFKIFYNKFASTINFNGVYLGIDKIGHFFKQGFQYYSTYTKIKSKVSMSIEDAEYLTIRRRGVRAEKSYFGSMLTGIFSHGDLAANFAGFKFYQGIFNEVQLGDKAWGPLLTREKNGQIFFHEKFIENPGSYLRAFITDHFNEALNPSIYSKNLRSSVKMMVKRQCNCWVDFLSNRGINLGSLYDYRKSLQRWNGYYYGHGEKDFEEGEELISLDNQCYI